MPNPFKDWNEDRVRAHNEHIEARRRHAKAIGDKISAEGVSPSEPERTGRKALVHKRTRKAKSRPCFEIVFNVYAQHPLDWDNWHTKSLQDVLVRTGFLHGDDWRVLQGRVVAHKADSEAEERTEVTITQVDSFGPYGPDGDAKWSGPS